MSICKCISRGNCQILALLNFLIQRHQFRAFRQILVNPVQTKTSFNKTFIANLILCSLNILETTISFYLNHWNTKNKKRKILQEKSPSNNMKRQHERISFPHFPPFVCQSWKWKNEEKLKTHFLSKTTECCLAWTNMLKKVVFLFLFFCWFLYYLVLKFSL